MHKTLSFHHSVSPPPYPYTYTCAQAWMTQDGKQYALVDGEKVTNSIVITAIYFAESIGVEGTRVD